MPSANWKIGVEQLAARQSHKLEVACSRTVEQLSLVFEELGEE
jgi:hypothetical protein